MGKAILIFVGAITIAGAYFSLNGQRAQYETEASLATDAIEILARNAALAGLDHAEQLLADDFRNYNNVTGTSDGGAYDVRATRKGKKRVVIRATGTSQTRGGESVAFNIRAEYERKPWPRIASEPPTFMQYLLMADGALSLRGGAEGQVYVPDADTSVPANADMHTNAALEVEGKNAGSEGFGTYVTAALPDLKRVKKAFSPNDNPTESDHAYQTAEVAIPPMDPSAMALALEAGVDSVTSGNVLVSSQADLPVMDGSRTDPFIWHIQGNLTFLDNAVVEFPGYVMLLIDGSLTISPNVQMTTPEASYEGVDESSLALYVGGLATLSGQTEVWAQIFGNDVNILAEGLAKLYGNIVTRGSINFGGNAEYYYRQASPALTTFFQGGFNDRLERLSYSEW